MGPHILEDLTYKNGKVKSSKNMVSEVLGYTLPKMNLEPTNMLFPKEFSSRGLFYPLVVLIFGGVMGIVLVDLILIAFWPSKPSSSHTKRDDRCLEPLKAIRGFKHRSSQSMTGCLGIKIIKTPI